MGSLDCRLGQVEIHTESKTLVEYEKLGHQEKDKNATEKNSETKLALALRQGHPL